MQYPLERKITYRRLKTPVIFKIICDNRASYVRYLAHLVCIYQIKDSFPQILFNETTFVMHTNKDIAPLISTWV